MLRQRRQAAATSPNTAKCISGYQATEGLCRKFSCEAICGMISLPDQGRIMRERTNGDPFQGGPFPQELIFTSIRWYVAYPLSYRHVEELMEGYGQDACKKVP
jgi:hypothetical protein